LELPSVYDAKDQRRLRTPKEHPDRIYPAEKLIAEDLPDTQVIVQEE